MAYVPMANVYAIPHIQVPLALIITEPSVKGKSNKCIHYQHAHALIKLSEAMTVKFHFVIMTALRLEYAVLETVYVPCLIVVQIAV